MTPEAANDPLDLITWEQFRAAFQIAALALLEIEAASKDPQIADIATDALRAIQAEVGRFDISEPSWEPYTAQPRTEIPEPAPKEG